MKRGETRKAACMVQCKAAAPPCMTTQATCAWLGEAQQSMPNLRHAPQRQGQCKMRRWPPPPWAPAGCDTQERT